MIADIEVKTEVRMRNLSLIILFCIALMGCKLDPASGFMSAQRILIERNLGWGEGFVTRTGRETNAAKLVSENIAHIDNWYTTKMSGDSRLRYQMIVEKVGQNYFNRCFVTHIEIEQGEKPCF